MTEKLLRTEEAATFLGLSKAFLERDRWAGPTIPFIRVGSRAVRYRLADLESYISGKRQESSRHRDGRPW